MAAGIVTLADAGAEPVGAIVRIRVTPRRLSQWTGGDREILSRVLAGLADEGWIELTADGMDVINLASLPRLAADATAGSTACLHADRERDRQAVDPPAAPATVKEILGRLGQLVAAMRHPAIRRLQLAWTGCITAELAQSVGLAVVAFRLDGLAGVGGLGLLRSLPAALFGPFGASLADRYRRGRVLLAVLAVRGALMAACALILVTGWPPILVLGAATLDALVYSLWWPTQSALIPELAASPDEATAANVGTTVIENVGTLVGPLLGAALLTFGSIAAVFAVAAGLLATAAATVVPLAQRSEPARSVPLGAEYRGRLAGFRAGFGHREPRAVISLYLAQTFAFGMLGVLLVAAALGLLGLGNAGIGFLNAAVGAGGLVGGAAAIFLVGRRRLGTALGAALAACGVAVMVAGADPAVLVVVPMLALVGLASAVVDVAGLTLLQRVVPEPVLVRVLGVFEGLWWAMRGLGAIVGAALTVAVGVRLSLLVVGLLLLVLVAVAVRALRSVDEAAGPPAAALRRLRGVPFFGPLSPAALERLAFAAGVVLVSDGTVVVTEGEAGDAFYVIDDGTFDVSTGGQHRRLEAGASFGEIALLRDVPRTATVTGVGEGRLLEIPRALFLGALALNPSMHDAAQAHADRLLARQAPRPGGR